MSREDLHFRLRIPEELKGKVEQSASRNHRSMTAEIIARLEDSFDSAQIGLALQNRLMTDNQTRLKDAASRAIQALDDGDYALVRNLLVGAAWFEPPTRDAAKQFPKEANERS